MLVWYKLRPPPTSKIDFRYGAWDVHETFHKCWAHQSKVMKKFSLLQTSPFRSFLEIQAQNGPFGSTYSFSVYFNRLNRRLFYLKENCLLLGLRERDFLNSPLFNFGTAKTLQNPKILSEGFWKTGISRGLAINEKIPFPHLKHHSCIYPLKKPQLSTMK